MSVRPLVLGALIGATLALVLAVACIASGLSSFPPGLAGTILGAALTAGLGTIVSWLVRRIEPPASVSPWRLAGVGALFTTLPFLLLKSHPIGFIGLNEVGAGAGPLGELVLATLPLVGAYAGACTRLFANEKAARSGERAA